MEISFPAHTVQERSVSISEADMAKLYDIVKSCFLNHLRFARYEKGSFYTPYEKDVVSLCKKYQVDYTIEDDRLAFFEALLGISPADATETAN